MLPNIITASRIIITIVLWLLNPNTIVFQVLYWLCGLSDILDGYLARKLNCQTKIGATFDSIADLLFTITIGIKLFLKLHLNIYIYLWVLIIFISKIYIYLKNIKDSEFFHNKPNKFIGLFCFIAIFFIYYNNCLYLIDICLILASFVTIWEIKHFA